MTGSYWHEGAASGPFPIPQDSLEVPRTHLKFKVFPSAFQGPVLQRAQKTQSSERSVPISSKSNPGDDGHGALRSRRSACSCRPALQPVCRRVAVKAKRAAPVVTYSADADKGIAQYSYSTGGLTPRPAPLVHPKQPKEEGVIVQVPFLKRQGVAGAGHIILRDISSNDKKRHCSSQCAQDGETTW